MESKSLNKNLHKAHKAKKDETVVRISKPKFQKKMILKNMETKDLSKIYTFNKQKGNKGAAYLEYKLTDFVLMHHVDESKDIGNDFICELIDGESPTRILFFIQCKACKDKPSLESDKKIIGYWKEFDIPVYVFWVKDNFDIEYKRLTPYLHKGRRHRNEPFKKFKKINL